MTSDPDRRQTSCRLLPISKKTMNKNPSPLSLFRALRLGKLVPRLLGLPIVLLAAMAPPVRAAELPPGGTNLFAVTSWTPARPFSNGFKMSNSRWRRAGATVLPSDLNPDENGYPRNIAQGNACYVAIFGDVTIRSVMSGPPYPVGRYVLRWRGGGEIELRLDAAGGEMIEISNSGNIGVNDDSVKERIYNHTGSPLQLEGVRVYFLRASPTDYARDVEVYYPYTKADGTIGSTEEAGLFNPQWMDRFKPFHYIRFMDWGGTNDSKWKKWSDRTLPTNYTWEQSKRDDADALPRHAIPYEVMVALCNEIDADMWFCLPHLADNDFIDRLAELFLKGDSATGWPGLNPNRRIYLEFSNEVWNGSFEQGSIPWFQYGEKSARFWDRFTTRWVALGGEESRIVRILSGWVTQISNMEANLSGVTSTGLRGPDVLACHAYVGKFVFDYIHQSKKVDIQNPEHVQAGLKFMYDDLLPTGQPKNWVKYATLANSLGIPLVCYEGASGGGPSTPVSRAETWAFVDQLMVHPDIYDVYLKMLEQWEVSGGTSFTLFSGMGSNSSYGFWGHLNGMEHKLENAPRVRAFLDWMGEKSLSITPSTLATGLAGFPYEAILAASDPTLPGLVWEVVDEGRLAAAGLATEVTAAGLRIFGNAPATGSITFKVKLTSGEFQSEQDYVIAITSNSVPAITTQEVLSPASFGRPYQIHLQADGGNGTLTWALAAGSSLPEGMTLSATGLLSGTPGVIVSGWTFSAMVQDIDGDQDSRQFQLDIQDAPLEPIGDTYAYLDSPTIAMGQEVTFMSRDTTKDRAVAFLKFNVGGLTGIATAKLRLHLDSVASGETVDATLSVFSNDTWEEVEGSPLTHNNRPTGTETALGTIPVRGSGYFEWDVVQAVLQEAAGDGIISFTLRSTSSPRVYWSSKEGPHPPLLQITFDEEEWPAWMEGAQRHGKGIFSLPGLGQFYQTKEFTWHFDLGWSYFASATPKEYYLWDFSQAAWMWTSQTFYPYLWRWGQEHHSWIYFLGAENGSKRLYDFQTGQIETHPQ